MRKSKRRAKRALKRKNVRMNSQSHNGAFTIDPDLIEREIMKKAGANGSAIQRVVSAGMKLLFSPETHSKFFDSIRPNVPLEDELGAGTFHVMMILFNESKGTMPGEAFIPAGTILLAKASAYIYQTKMFPITDDTFTEALKMFVAVTKRASSQPQDKPGQQPATEQSGTPVQPQQVQPQPTQPQPTQPQPTQPQTGMLEGG